MAISANHRVNMLLYLDNNYKRTISSKLLHPILSGGWCNIPNSLKFVHMLERILAVIAVISQMEAIKKSLYSCINCLIFSAILAFINACIFYSNTVKGIKLFPSLFSDFSYFSLQETISLTYRLIYYYFLFLFVFNSWEWSSCIPKNFNPKKTGQHVFWRLERLAPPSFLGLTLEWVRRGMSGLPVTWPPRGGPRGSPPGSWWRRAPSPAWEPRPDPGSPWWAGPPTCSSPPAPASTPPPCSAPVDKEGEESVQ